MTHDIPKSQAEAAHFKARAAERYGVVINHIRYAELCRLADGWPVVHRQSSRVTVRAGEVDGVRIMVAYDSKRRRLVTALPPNCMDRDGRYLTRREREC